MMRRLQLEVLFLTAEVIVCSACMGQKASSDALAPMQAAERGASLGAQVQALMAQPEVARAHWGVMVTTLDGQPIYSLNAGQLFQPASNAKLFTTAAALALLGPDATFETRVVGALDVATGTVDGDLTIAGFGDANLSGRSLPYLPPGARANSGARAAAADPLRDLEEMADQVAARGVKAVNGDVVGDDTFFPWEPYPSDWTIDDAVWGYGAPVSALTINDNQIQVTVTPAGRPGEWATVSLVPAMHYYTVEAKVRTGSAKSGGSVQMERAPGSKVLRVYGTIAVDAGADVEEVAIQEPAEYAATAFLGMLKARGIVVKGAARAEHWTFHDERGFLSQAREPVGENQLGGVTESGYACSIVNGPRSLAGEPVLAARRSVPLSEDVVLTNKVSQNLHAELMLHLMAVRLCFPTNAQGARMVRSWLTAKAGIDGGDFVFYDGSGLSGHDLVTPRAIAKLLSYAAKDPKTGAPQTWFADWKASLPVGGEDGSLIARFPKAPLKDHVYAKTGTLGEARALSGYLDCASGQTVIFSILIGNHTPGSNADRDGMDRIVEAIRAAE